MEIINKDILTVKEGVVCQSVNCQKVMGSGLAKQIKDKYPQVYTDYLNHCDKYVNDFERLGSYVYTKVDSNLYICSIFGQLNYGTNERQTDYGALKEAFSNIIESFDKAKVNLPQFHFPYQFGCGLGGGDWTIVLRMIEFYFPNAIIYKI